MKIVHVDSHISWRGGEQQVVYLTGYLHDWGHQSLIVCQPHSALYQRASAAGVPTWPLRMRHEGDVVAAWQLGAYLRRRQVDLLHMHTPHAHMLGLMASMMAPSVKQVVSRRVDFAPRRNRLSRWKYTRPGVTYLAVSEAVRQVLIAGGVAAHQVQTVYSGIDLERFEAVPQAAPLFAAGTRVVGTVGHLAGHKGHRFLLDALPDVVRTEPQVGLVIAGSGALRLTLETQAAALGLADRVRFTGFRQDILALMRGFEVFVFPSVLEGLGTAILDAMALGKPVVATRAGGIPEVVEDGVTGLLVPARDPEALARALCHVLQHPEQGRAFGEAGRKRVERHFTAARMAAQTLQVYQQLGLDQSASHFRICAADF
ncbi:D-inositol-3-phosphate glycosyltransferase [Candidatus Entotheonellaceae bacterium PAL068K]